MVGVDLRQITQRASKFCFLWAVCPNNTISRNLLSVETSTPLKFAMARVQYTFIEEVCTHNHNTSDISQLKERRIGFR